MIGTPQQLRAPRAAPRSLDGGEDVADRAERLITGGNSLLFNSWRRVRTVDATFLAFPLGLEITAEDQFALGGSNVGLTWDNAETLEAPSQQVLAGQTLPIVVNQRRGRVLEVWADDAQEVTVQTVNANELERRAADREAQKKKEDDDSFGLGDLGQGIIDTQKMVVVAVVVVVLVLGVTVAKSWNGALPSPGVKL